MATLEAKLGPCGVLGRLYFSAQGLTLLIGPNGAGKTTLLKVLSGLEKCRGTCWLDGREVCSLPPWERGVGYVPQSLALFRHMTVAENIAYGLIARGRPRKEALEEARRLARMLGVENVLERPAWMLSGGERQRVALARALAVRPRLLLLDEALDHVDEGTRTQLVRKIRRYVDSENAVAILVTHHVGEIISKVGVNTLLVMHEGRILYQGPPAPEAIPRPLRKILGCFEKASVLGCSDGLCIAKTGHGAVAVPRGWSGLVYSSPSGTLYPVAELACRGGV